MTEPKWKVNKREYNKKYKKDHERTITIHLSDNDDNIITMFKKIPNKAQWFRDSVKKYFNKENPK